MRSKLEAALLVCPLIFSLTSCGSQYETQSQTDPLAYRQSYCDMEASCIPVCSCEMGYQCLCDSTPRAQYCRTEYLDWVDHYVQQGDACKKSLASWLSCITRTSCSNVETFLEGHPDDLKAGDPCAKEFFNLVCDDFEPPAEYSFDPYMVFDRLDDFTFAASTYKEIDFEDLPFDASNCLPGPGGSIPNPLDKDGVVFTDPGCLDTGFCSSPTCQPDPDNPDGGNNELFLNLGGTIDFPDGTEGFLIVVQGMGDNSYGLKVTDSKGGSFDIRGNAVSFGVSYLGMLSANGISRAEVTATGPGSNCTAQYCGPMVLSDVLYGSR